MKVKPNLHPSQPQLLGAVSVHRHTAKDGTVREYEYKVIKAVGPHGDATTVCFSVDETYALMREYDLTIGALTRVIQDAAKLLAASSSPNRVSGLNWSHAVFGRTCSLLRAMNAERALAVENNEAWSEQ